MIDPGSSTPTVLPDVAYDVAAFARPIDWVGMAGIALPLMVDGLTVPALADVHVDLADAHARGIHMSRLYLTLQGDLAGKALGPGMLLQILQDCIASQGGASAAARVHLAYDHLLLRRALVSDNAGWKHYPVRIEGERRPEGTKVTLQLEIDYSSTCPASAALSRQLNAQRFDADFGEGQVDAGRVRDWLGSTRGMAATPHAQRSRATVRLELAADAGTFPVRALVDRIEEALATPVQSAVKREDEQAFARRNADNLMFCEDAVRRVAAALQGFPEAVAFEAHVAHFESLHAHDAVASLRGRC